MVLLALRWKGEPKSPELAVDPSERLLDIYVGEQMTEEYLQKNWKGQVPCLLGPQSFKCDDSLDITLYLGERYPRLLPRVHSRAIKTLLYELHQIWFVSLSFRAEEGRGEAIVKSIHHLMSQPTSSDEYKAALQKKLEFLMEGFPDNPHDPEIVAREECKTRTYLGKVLANMAKHNPGCMGPWIFGDEVGPTALDVQTVVFIARLVDAGRQYLIDADLLAYGKAHLEGKEWRDITKGQSTLHSVWEAESEGGKGLL